MMHLPALIQDLGFILITATIVTLLFKKLNQPIVLGYLIAGFILGPNFPFFPTVKDVGNITIWGDIGVIFMLFGLGLEFSFKKLTKTGKRALITATFEIAFLLGAGFLTGQLLGWSKIDSLFLGGILSISSTTIIVKTFEELGLKGKNFVSLVFGILIVEDLIAILLLVLLSSFAITQSLSGMELGYFSLRLAFFMVLWFLLGIYIIPVMLRKTRDFMTNETMLIFSIALCFFMVTTASYFGFSPALGAFIMGAILAETREGHRIEQLILPVKDLFSAVFFVSVGMLIDPKVLMEYFWVILLITVLTIIGKFISTSIGALISGCSLKNSVKSGASLAQIGEFSFIIATLGITLKVTSDFLYPIAVAVSAITTFTTPYFIRHADPIYGWVERKLPMRLKQSLADYAATMSANAESTMLSLLWREYGIKTMLNSVVVIAISLTMSKIALPQLNNYFTHQAYIPLIVCFITLVLVAPFLWAVFLGRPSHVGTYQSEIIAKLQRLQIGISITRFLFGCVLVGFVVSNFTSLMAFSGVFLIALAALGAFFFSRFSEPLYLKIERRFMANLTENERAALEKKNNNPDLAPWDAVLMEFTLSPNSHLITQSLQQAKIKENFGVTVAMIERGTGRILAPQKHDLLLPHDKLFLIGSEEQLSAIKETLDPKIIQQMPAISNNFGLTSLTLSSSDPFVNKTIRDCGLREAVHGLIVGLERNGERLLSPDSSMQLLAGDLLWIVGEISLIKALRAQTS